MGAELRRGGERDERVERAALKRKTLFWLQSPGPGANFNRGSLVFGQCGAFRRLTSR